MRVNIYNGRSSTSYCYVILLESDWLGYGKGANQSALGIWLSVASRAMPVESSILECGFVCSSACLDSEEEGIVVSVG